MPIYSVVSNQFETESLYALVFMPTLIEFVSWVLDDAVKSGKQRLYFLARDGYQMYLVAKRLCEIKQINIECRYLKVSRYAMRMPEYHLLEENCVDYICTGGIDVTIERIMLRAGLSEEHAKQYFPDRDVKRILNYQEVMQLKTGLKEKESFLNEIYKLSKQAYEPAVSYLKQEGLFDDVNFALVDSGWVGTLQKSLSRLIGKENLEGYYFGIYEIPRDVDSKLYHSFYFGPKIGLRRKVNFSNCLFEAIFTSPEGMTLRYEERDCEKETRYEPVADFRENPNRILVEENCKLLEKYMDAYESVYHSYKTQGNEGVSVVEQLLSKCMGNPTELELEEYGDVLFSDDILEGNLKKVAADLSQEEIREQRFINKVLIMLGIKKTELHESAWIEGSIVRCGGRVKSNLFHAKLYKYFVYIRKMFR